MPSLAREWFEQSWERLGGWLREALDACPLADREVTVDLLNAQVNKHYPAIGQPFMLLAAQTGDNGVQDWHRLYCDNALHDFLKLVSSLPAMASMVLGGIVEPATEYRSSGMPGRPRFHPSMWRYSNENKTSLLLEVRS